MYKQVGLVLVVWFFCLQWSVAQTTGTISGVVRVTAGSAPAFCIAWGQTASNATASDLNIGSNMVLTRLN